jgi:plastocyanin/mono/diheme cytochrome c family protein
LNTYKQVNIMIGLLFVGLVGTFLYYMFDSGYSIAGLDFGNRQAVANERQELDNAERGGALFARNCRACHGITGTGALERTGLPGLPLNQDANRPPGLAASQVEARQQRFSDTIHCGRVGTIMPPWATDQGGSLGDFQIFQLVTLITSRFAPEGWDHAVEEANHSDLFDPPKFLAEAVTPDDDTIVLTDVSAMQVDDVIRIGLEEPGQPYELMVITEIDTENHTVTVDRGSNVLFPTTEAVLGSDPIAHEAGAQVFIGPIAPTGTLVGDPESEADAPCGQNKAVPAAPAEPAELADGATITMGDNFFELDGKQNPEFTVAAGAPITVTLQNSGAAIHNMRIDGTDQEYDSDDDVVSDPDLIMGGDTGTITIDIAAGTYNYRCDFHPDQMKGTVVVQ